MARKVGRVKKKLKKFVNGKGGSLSPKRLSQLFEQNHGIPVSSQEIEGILNESQRKRKKRARRIAP